jgi:hypothetical protein
LYKKLKFSEKNTSFAGMQSTFLTDILPALTASERLALRKWLASPFVNHRTDVLKLYKILEYALESNRLHKVSKAKVWRRIYPGEPFDRDRINHLFSFLLKKIERFLAFAEWENDVDGLVQRLYLCRALRKRGLPAAFERHAERLEAVLNASPHRHAAHFLVRHQLAGQRFHHGAVARRGGREEARQAVEALDRYYAIENLGWACTLQSLQTLSSEPLPFSPLTAPVLELAEQAPVDDNSAATILYESFQLLAAPEPEPHFERLKLLLLERSDVFPGAESRDQYMAAINYCIRRHNRGDRTYTREAFDLYRIALDRGVLVENGRMPAYTYTNINLLAHVAGESVWALGFLERYRPALPAAERDNTYRYNLAFHHFRGGRYGAVLDLLQQVEFSEVFVSLDVRKMLLRSYFELGEYAALDSLLASFRTFLRRRHELGYHRESYLNLLKFTKKLVRAVHASPRRRKMLADAIRAERAVAEREWLLQKVEQ